MVTSEWIEEEAVVGSPVGLHARPAGALVKAAKKYGCEVSIGRPGAAPVNAKSMLKLLTLGVGHGERVVLAARGDEAGAAVHELAELIRRSED